MALYKTIKNSSTKRLQIYNTATELPAESQIATLAFVQSAGKLFLFTGTGWLPIVTSNEAPSWLNKPSETVDVLIGNTYSITVAYTDPEAVKGTFSYDITSGDPGANVITLLDDAFSIAATEQAEFTLTFTASDGTYDITSTTSFTVRREEWLSQAKLRWATETAANSYLGSSVDISGNTIVVGGYNYNIPSASCGAAIVFVRDGETWTRQQLLQSSDIALGDQFGYSVAIDGDLIAVGAYADDNSTYTNNGAVYIFQRIGEVWSQISKINGEAVNGAFSGKSVALSNNYLVIGSPGISSAKGRVRILSTSDGGYTWTSLRTIDSTEITELVNNSKFGESVAIDGNPDTPWLQTVVIGAPGHISNKGAAWIVTNVSDWTDPLDQSITKVTGTYDIAGDEYGTSVAVRNNSVVIGVPLSDLGAFQAGTAYVYEYNSNNATWPESHYLLSDDIGDNDRFGTSVSITETTLYPGNNVYKTIAVGASNLDNVGGFYTFIYDDGSNSYVQNQKTVDATSTIGDGSGKSVSIDGNYIVVGSPNSDSNTTVVSNVGVAYTYYLN